MRLIILLVTATLLTACAGKVDYVRPTIAAGMGTNSKIINKPRDVVWNSSVPELGKRYFVINNLDKASGLINVSYSGDPEKYIDCGNISSYVKNAAGERTYNFPGSRAQQRYEIMAQGTTLVYLDRRMSVEGRVNLVFEEISANQTRVTANTRYIVQRNITAQPAGGLPQSRSDTISFNSMAGASFDSSGQTNSTECVANGMLEKEILSAVN